MSVGVLTGMEKLNIFLMSDTRFKWAISVAAITCVAITAIVCLLPRDVRRQPQSQPREYVYVDAFSIVHADRKCSRLNYKGIHSERVPFKKIRSMDVASFCPKCVSDDDYKMLTGKDGNWQ